MPVPSVKGYTPLCYTLRSHVCDEQGIGQWPMWQRYDSVKAIVDQYIDEPYRHFFALPRHEVDKLKGEEVFYWYTPRSDSSYTRMSNTGDDHEYYKKLLDETLAHYKAIVERLKREDKIEEANFLQTSLKYAGDTEENVYCGDGRVVATVWGMRPRPGCEALASVRIAELEPEKEMHTVRYDLGSYGNTMNSTSLRKSHGSEIYAHQVPEVTTVSGYEFIGWDRNPVGVKVDGDLLFMAQYRELPKPEKPKVVPPVKEKPPKEPLQMHHVRFLAPDNSVIKEMDVEHGKTILPGDVPQLPVVDNLFCQGWNGDPLNDIINQDRDYKAIPPVAPDAVLHTVRFLAPGGEVLSQFQVEDGTQLTPDQVPALPVVDGDTCPGWNKDPLKEKITADTDFVAKTPSKKRGGFWTALLKWLLLALGLLLLFLLLWCFIFDKCHLNLCRCDCGCHDTVIVVRTDTAKKVEPNRIDTIRKKDKLPEPTKNCGVHFSGVILGDTHLDNHYSIIFGNDPMGEYVGSGYYPNNSETFPKAVRHSFDAIAVDKGTRLIIYERANFQGKVLLDVVGPILITNVFWKNDSRYNWVENKTFSPDLQEIFPPSRRQWSSGNMHDWSEGSCKIICEQCEEK